MPADERRVSDEAAQKLIYVKWLDNNGIAEWAPQDQITEQLVPAVAESCGWILQETKDSVTIAATRCQTNKTASKSTLILKKCIVKRMEIK